MTVWAVLSLMVGAICVVGNLFAWAQFAALETVSLHRRENGSILRQIRNNKRRSLLRAVFGCFGVLVFYAPSWIDVLMAGGQCILLANSFNDWLTSRKNIDERRRGGGR